VSIIDPHSPGFGWIDTTKELVSRFDISSSFHIYNINIIYHIPLTSGVGDPVGKAVGAEVGDPVGAPVADFDLLLPLAGDNIYDIDASDSSPLIVLR